MAGGCLSCGYFYVRENDAVNVYRLMCGAAAGNRKWNRMRAGIFPALIFTEVKEIMELKSFDNLQQAKDLVRGLRDIMFYMETAEQDRLIPVTILAPSEAVLEKSVFPA